MGLDYGGWRSLAAAVTMETTIRSTAELLALKQRRTRRGVSRVLLDLPWADTAVRDTEAEINRRLRACGCGMAAAFSLLGTFIIVLRLALGNARPTIAGMIALWFAFVLTGKILGIALAERGLHSAIDRLARMSDSAV